MVNVGKYKNTGILWVLKPSNQITGVFFETKRDSFQTKQLHLPPEKVRSNLKFEPSMNHPPGPKGKKTSETFQQLVG